MLDGVIDFHMHVGYARMDPVAQLKLASRAGMRGLVFKIGQFPTVELAHTTTQVVREWAEHEGMRPAEAFGGLVHGNMVGGINLRLVRRVIAIGGRVVWLPALESPSISSKLGACPVKKLGAKVSTSWMADV